MADTDDGCGKAIGSLSADFVEHPGIDQRSCQPADRRSRQTGAFRNLAIAQRVNAGPESPEDFDARSSDRLPSTPPAYLRACAISGLPRIPAKPF
ncbi:hypothetical protein N0U25_28870, partial [Pseudomonas sivasensis]